MSYLINAVSIYKDRTLNKELIMTKIISPNFNANALVIKENSESVVKMIRKHLKVGCKPSHALDIAASVFVKDYQTLKGLYDKDFYQLSANIGDYSNPIHVTKDLGFFDSIHLANDKADSVLESCSLEIEWRLIKNGKPTHVKINTNPAMTMNGITVTAIFTGKTVSDALQGVEEARSELESGFKSGGDQSGSSTYEYEVYGSDFESPVATDGKAHYCITDSSGWVGEFFDYDEALKVFNEAGDNGADITSWTGDLNLLAFIDDHDGMLTSTGDDVENDDLCFALEEDGSVYHYLEFSEVLSEIDECDMSETPDILYMYKILGNKAQRD